jgi:hypothetical protein
VSLCSFDNFLYSSTTSIFLWDELGEFFDVLYFKLLLSLELFLNVFKKFLPVTPQKTAAFVRFVSAIFFLFGFLES